MKGESRRQCIYYMVPIYRWKWALLKGDRPFDIGSRQRDDTSLQIILSIVKVFELATEYVHSQSQWQGTRVARVGEFRLTAVWISRWHGEKPRIWKPHSVVYLYTHTHTYHSFSALNFRVSNHN